MSSPTSTTTWQDRRGMFQKGKEVHEPGRRPSESGGGIADAVRRASVTSTNAIKETVGAATGGTGGGAASGQRRRSSVASNGGLFANLTNHKRGSEDYGERRVSHTDQIGTGGALSGWWNSTFRGVQKPGGGQDEQK